MPFQLELWNASARLTRLLLWKRLGVCSQDTLLFDSLVRLFFNKFKKRRKEMAKKKPLLLPFFLTLADRNLEQKRQFDLLMWEITFPSEI